MKMYKDGLYGLSVGEAFGVQLDNEERSLRNPVINMCEYRAYDVEGGLYSDDTVSALVVMNSYLFKREFDSCDIALKYCDWINTNEYSSCDMLFDISKTVRFSLMDYWKNKDITLSGRCDDKSQDASSLTRMYPLAIYLDKHNLKDDEIIEIVRKMTIFTHNSEYSVLGNFIFLKLLIYILNGNDLKQALSSVKRYKYSKYFKDETIDKYNKILKSDIKSLRLSDINTNSSVVSVLESSLWILTNTTNYKDSIISTCAIGGANGVRASITGLLAGLLYGKKNIPKDWLEVLKRKDYLEKSLKKYISII